MRMLVQARLENAHEKEKTKRDIREEEQEEAKRERHREWRVQLQKQKERGHISVDVDHFTNEQMERMVFDKDYNPLKQQGEREKEEESDPEDEARKAELRARFAAAS